MNSLNHQDQIPILVGPTGVGKSEVAYRLALKYGFEIISADAFQVYHGMAVGTVQPSLEYQQKVQHHLIGVRKPTESWSAVQFSQAAREIIDQIEKKEKLILIVGGAGFYIRALVDGLPPGGAPSLEVRKKVMKKIAELGVKKAHQWLATRDETAAQRINPQDVRRIARALEKTFEVPKGTTDYQPLGLSRVLFLGLERSRENLDKRLQERTRGLWEGLLKESEYLLSLNLPQDHPALAAIGYHEAIAFLSRTMSREAALEKIYHRTRQYAKRQWTWFKNQQDVEWLNLDEFDSMDDLIEKIIHKIDRR